jgi:hypothetical protein
LVAGPLEVIQQGIWMSVRVDREHPDYTEFRAAMDAEVADTPMEVERLRREIRILAQPFHAFDVLFAVWSTFGIVKPGTLRPIGTGGSSATTEYVAHVLLDRSGPAAEREPTRVEMLQGSPDPQRLGALVAEILQRYPVWFVHRQLGEQDDLDPWLDLRARLYMHRLTIRSFSYEWQERATLENLFGAHSQALRSRLGFDVSQALSLIESVALLPRERARGRGAEAREFAALLSDWTTERRRGGAPNAGSLTDLVARLAALGEREAESQIKRIARSGMANGLGQHAAFTAQELGEHAGVSVAVTEAFLRRFSVQFGHRSDAHEWEVHPERAIGWEMEAMRQHPIVHDGEGRHLPVSVESLFYGLRDVLTDALKESPSTWQRFRKRRGEDLERRAGAALAQALNADWLHESVRYWMPDGQGGVTQGEADAILRADGVVVIVESKAGSMHPSARRTAPDRLEAELRKLVVEAHTQLMRDEAALVDGTAIRVFDATGNDLTLDVEGAVRVLHVAVTLEDLSPVAPAAWQFQDAGLLPGETSLPWVVGIHELELICELVERPAQFVHYVLRRQRTYRQRVWAVDEMDFFMKYLRDGLYFEDKDLGDSALELQNHTDELDAYLYGERNLGPPRKRPRQRVNGATRRLLDQIEATGADGRLEGQIMVLEMSTASRERVAAAARQLTRKVATDGKPHDMSLVFTDDFAITIHVVPEPQNRDLPERLAHHGIHRAEASGLRRWLGLGYVAGRSRLVAMAVIADPSRLPEPPPAPRRAGATK